MLSTLDISITEMDFPSDSELLDELISFPTIPNPVLPVPESESGDPIGNKSTAASNYIHRKCVICSAQFFYSKNESLEEWEELSLAFCRSFEVSETLSLSHFHETIPFCSKCKKETKKLLTLQNKLENIQAELEKIQFSIATTIVKTFPTEVTQGSNYPIKKYVFDSKAF